MKSDNILHRLHRPGSATHVSLLRVALGLAAFYASSSMIFPLLQESGYNEGYVAFIPAHLIAQIQADYLLPLARCTQVLGLLFAAGLLTRVVTPALLVSFTLLFSVYYSAFGHPVHWIYLFFPLLLMCFARSADVFSIDALLRNHLRRKRPVARDPAIYRWPIELMVAWFAYIYVAGAISKMFPLQLGVIWLEGYAIKSVFVGRFLDSPLYYLGTSPLWNYAESFYPFVALSVVAMLTEMSALLLLWGTRWRMLVLPAIFGMHLVLLAVGVAGFLIPAFALSLACLPSEWFFRWDPNREKQAVVDTKEHAEELPEAVRG